MDKRLLSSEQAGSEIIPVDAIGDRSPRKALTDEVGAAGLRMQRFRAAQRPTIRAANEQEALACSCVAVVGAANNLVIELESARSEERRVGKECVRTCRSRWSPDP